MQATWKHDNAPNYAKSFNGELPPGFRVLWFPDKGRFLNNRLREIIRECGFVLTSWSSRMSLSMLLTALIPPPLGPQTTKCAPQRDSKKQLHSSLSTFQCRFISLSRIAGFHQIGVLRFAPRLNSYKVGNTKLENFLQSRKIFFGEFTGGVR